MNINPAVKVYDKISQLSQEFYIAHVIQRSKKRELGAYQKQPLLHLQNNVLPISTASFGHY